MSVTVPDEYLREFTAYDVLKNKRYTRFDLRYGSLQIGLCYEERPSKALREKARRRLQKSLRIRLNRWGLPKSDFVKLTPARYH